MAQGFNVQYRNAAIGLGQSHTHTFHAEGCNQCWVFWNPVWGCNMLQLHAIALNQSVLESRWKVVCAVSLTLLNWSQSISVPEIVHQESVPVLNLEESETQSKNMIWGGTSLTFRIDRNRLNFKACVPRSCANPFLWIAPKIPPLAPGCFESKCPVDPSRLKAEVLCSQFDA